MRHLILALLLASPVTAFAAEGVHATSDAPTASSGSILFAPKVGFFKTTTPLTGALYAAAEVGVVTPLLDRKLAIVLEGDWHLPKVSNVVSDTQLTVDSNTAPGNYTLIERELSVLLTAVYRAEGALGPVTPYGGVGPGWYYHRATITSFGSTYVEQESTFGFQALVGLEMALGPGAAFLEAHYHFTNIDFLSTGKVNVGGFLAASIGYRFRF